jgi:serine/threonine protein kinase
MEPDRKCPRCGAVLPLDTPEGLCPACLAKAALGTEPGPTAGNATQGTSPSPPPLQEIARHFPQLEILELIGQGGMGVVYKARQTKLDRIVALKILPLESGKDPAFAERFAREARTLARLNHPNIVAIYDFGEAGGLFYFLMEYVDGLNLRELEQSRQLSAEQALAIVPKICDALQFAHEEGIVHRDIKPGNILIDRKGRVKIADFGLAKLLGQTAPNLTLTSAGHRMGTPHYMAPEQIDRPQLVDHRADIYSLGVVFYEMLTGELPVGRFAAPSQKVHVDVRLDEVVLRALENNPERRYQQASEVRTDVESIASRPPPRFHAAPSPSPNPRGVPGEFSRAGELVKIPGFALTMYAIANLVLVAIPLILGLSKTAMLFGRSPIGGFPVETWPMAFLPLPLLFLASQICLLIGASKLRNLSSYGWALAAALIAFLPAGPLWIVGIGLGIWTLIVIHQPDVRAAFGQPIAPLPPGTVAAPNPPGAIQGIPIFSRKAIAGACLIAAALALLLAWMVPLTTAGGPVLMTHSPPPVQSIRFATAPFLLLLAPFILGLPIAATILGMVAIKDIRYSNGRMVGLSLALADALFFPLLMLDVLMLILLRVAVRGAGSYLLPHRLPSIDHSLIVGVFVVGLLFCTAVDYLIVSACWRAARRPANSYPIKI